MKIPSQEPTTKKNVPQIKGMVSFRKVLTKSLPIRNAAPLQPIRARGAQTLTVTQRLVARRNEMHVVAETRIEYRKDARENQTQKTNDRIQEYIRRDFETETTNDIQMKSAGNNTAPPLPQTTQSTNRFEAPQAIKADVPVSSILALAERVQIFIRNNRTTLAMTLDPAMGGFVEIQKTGTRQIELTVGGDSKLKNDDSLDKLRTCLAARGLSVTVRFDDASATMKT